MWVGDVCEWVRWVVWVRRASRCKRIKKGLPFFIFIHHNSERHLDGQLRALLAVLA